MFQGENSFGFKPKGGGGGGNVNYIAVTKAELDALILANGLFAGTLYGISGCDVPLYGGTLLFIEAISSNKLSDDGTGQFYNPKYNQAVAGFNVWTNLSTWSTSAHVGNFEVNEPVTSNNGATGIIFANVYSTCFVAVSGNWGTSTSFTGDNSGSTANVGGVVLKTYAIGNTVHWGGKTWTNTTGNLGSSSNIFTLNADWTAIAFNSVDYNEVYDLIKYDYPNDRIIYRNEDNSNIVSSNNSNINFFATSLGFSNPIKAFQWGNLSILSDNKAIGIKQQFIKDSLNENINFRGKYQTNLNFINESYQRLSYFEIDSYQDKINLSDGSIQKNLYLSDSCYQQRIDLSDVAYQRTLGFSDRSGQSDLTFNVRSHQQTIQLWKNCSQAQFDFTVNSYQESINLKDTCTQTQFDFTNNSGQVNVILNTSADQGLFNFDNSSSQQNIFLTNSDQYNFTFNGQSSQNDYTAIGGGIRQQILNISNGGMLSNLVSNGGFSQRNVTIIGFNDDRTALPLIASEIDRIFTSTLPVSLTAIDMLVFEGNQFKIKSISVTSGIWGIADSSGVYTYYATYALALAQAISISAKCIELFADIIISSGTSLILTNGININGNGHTINCTLSTINVFWDNNTACVCTVDNLHVIHTGATNSSVYIENINSDITWNGRITNFTDGQYAVGVYNAGTFRNAVVKGSTCLYGLGVNGGTFENCTTFGINSGRAVRMTTGGYVNNCNINSSNTHTGIGLEAGAIMNNCTVIYKGTYRGVEMGSASEINNCTIVCTTGIGVVLFDTSKISLSNVKASTNVAVSNYSSNIDAVDNCILEGLTTGAIESNGCVSRNSTFISRLAPTLNNYYPPLMYNCDIICDWNNSGGHAVAETANGLTLVDCRLKVRHASAVGLYTAGPNVNTGDYYFSGLTMIGSSNLKSADITNLVTNTPDAQGNLILI